MTYLTRHVQYILTALLMVFVAFSLFLNQAQAQYSVRVVSDTSLTSRTQLATQANLLNKEIALDVAAKAAARMIIRQMVNDTINWINSGFRGSPAFITNLDQYLLNIADQAAVGFLNSQGFGFLCEPFQLDVQIAVATQYNQYGREQGTYTPQCTLEDVSNNIEGFLDGSFSSGGGWASWLELTQGSTNDPNNAMFEAQIALDAAIRDAEGNAITELDWGNGFLSFKVCADTDVASGAQSNCDIVTPGQTIANQLNSALNVGRDELITADEINEIIGALLAQLANRALSMGIGALSGSRSGGGGGGFVSDTSSGGNGQTYDSYLDALNDPNNPTNSYEGPGSSNANPYEFDNAVAMYREYITALQGIVDTLEQTRTAYDALDSTCSMDYEYPTQLTTWRNQYEGTIAVSRIRLSAIEELYSRYQTALENRDTAERTRILEEFNNAVRRNEVVSNFETSQVMLFREYTMRPTVDEFNSALSRERAQCNDDTYDDVRDAR